MMENKDIKEYHKMVKELEKKDKDYLNNIVDMFLYNTIYWLS